MASNITLQITTKELLSTKKTHFSLMIFMAVDLYVVLNFYFDLFV